MSSHYYLAVETPEGNLVEGMRWLQGTFGIRFNALREERGHVFQSRYKSKPHPFPQLLPDSPFAELDAHNSERNWQDSKGRAEARKSAEWKVRIARELRARTTATNAWIAERLAMGHPTRVCNLIRENM